MTGADEAVSLTQALVRIGSENPTSTEAEMSAFVADWLRRLPGVTVETHEVEPGRENVVARLGPGTGRDCLAYVAHMDTVPVGDGWTRGPLGGEIEGDLLYGRGSCDMKAGLASAMVAFAEVARSGARLSRDFLLCATVDEEGPFMQGAEALVREGIVGAETLVVAPEPSDMDVIVSHKGLVWFEVECRGRLAHAGNPHEGVDAIRAGAAFIQCLQRLVQGLDHEHPIVGAPTATFSAFRGGIKTNVVPDYCRIEVDMRIPTPMTVSDAHDLVTQAAGEAEAEVPGAAIALRQLNNDRPPIDADAEGELARALLTAAGEALGRRATTGGFPAYTDASIIAAKTGNRNGIVFGPGRLAQAHTVDEFVPVDQIRFATRTLTTTALALCSEEGRTVHPDADPR